MRDATRRQETSSALSLAQMEAVGESCDVAGTRERRKAGSRKAGLLLVSLHDASSVRGWKRTGALLRIALSAGRAVLGHFAHQT